MERLSKIYPDVVLGEGTIEEFCVIGHPLKGEKLETKIGGNHLIRSHTVIYAGTEIGNDFRTGHGVLIRERNKIGNNVSVGTGTVIERDSVIKDNARLHSSVFVPEYTTIEEGAWIGPNVVMTNAPHPLCPKAKECMKGPTIGKNAKIGANTTILPFLKIGKNSLVGAGSVVVEDVPPDSVVAGNPAEFIKKIGELECKFGYVKKPY